MKIKMKRRLETMLFDMAFIVDGSEELCHATGWEVLDEDGFWWQEFEDSNGDRQYGR